MAFQEIPKFKVPTSIMPLLEIAQSFGLFMLVCLAMGGALCLLVIVLSRLELATVAEDHPVRRRTRP